MKKKKEEVEVIDVVNKKELDILSKFEDKFIISRIYNVSIPIDRIRYFEIIDADQDSSKIEIDLPPFALIAYTNLDGLDTVPIEEYDNIQDAFDAMYEYSSFTFNKREMED